MKAYEFIPKYTYNDYAQWQGDWELISGYPHAMSPSPKKNHQRAGKKLIGKLDELLEENSHCKQCEVFYDLDWIISDDTIVRPDVMLVCGKMQGDFLNFAPTIAIEILSPSSTLRDKNIKHQLYQEQGVKYYIIVNPENKSCSIFELVDSAYIEKPTLQNFQLHDNCNLVFDITAFVQQLNLD